MTHTTLHCDYTHADDTCHCPCFDCTERRRVHMYLSCASRARYYRWDRETFLSYWSNIPRVQRDAASAWEATS
jgi:hypothetical protein